LCDESRPASIYKIRVTNLVQKVNNLSAIKKRHKLPTGGHYNFKDLRHAPPPIQKQVPIMIGGNGRTKTLRTIAR